MLLFRKKCIFVNMFLILFIKHIRKLYIIYIIFLFSNISIAQTNNESNLETLNTNEVYPEATFEWDDEGRREKMWITWPDGRKELVRSFYIDDDVTNGIDRFYIILTNDIEQTFVIKDKKFLEEREKRKEIYRKGDEKLKELKEIQKKKMFRKKIIVGTSLLVLLSIPFVFTYFSKFRKQNI